MRIALPNELFQKSFYWSYSKRAVVGVSVWKTFRLGPSSLLFEEKSFVKVKITKWQYLKFIKVLYYFHKVII